MKHVLAVTAVIAAVFAIPQPQTDSKKWDVTADLGPVQKVAFDTSEGTWMNLDVSPDGRQVVFDLLGDIYTMPAGGTAASQATRITSGPPFDMQPRFSPDGKRIAFSSDRDGLWNIWTMDADGKNANQVSREKRWFINSPAWSRDGSYIFARRPLRRFAFARRGGNLDVPRRGVGRSPGHGEKTAFRRTPANPPCPPTAATSITARTSRPDSSSSTTRTRTERSTQSSGAI